MPNRSAPTDSWQRLGTRVAFDQSTAADHTIVAGVAGKTIRVLGWKLTIAAAVNITWKTSLPAPFGSGSISGVYVFGSGGIDEPVLPFQCYETSEGEALILTLSGAVRVSGDVWYETY